MADISKDLQELFERFGKRPAEIARDTGIPPSRISEIITGSNKNPKLDTLQRIVEAVGGEICFVPAGKDTRSPPQETPTVNENLPCWPTKELEHLIDVWKTANPIIQKAALRMLEESANELREKEQQAKGLGGSTCAGQKSA